MSETNLAESKPTEPLPRPARRRRWVTILLALVIFLSGVIVGAGAFGLGLRNFVLRRIHHPELGPPATAAWLQRKLELTDPQTTEIEKILRQRQAALVAIRREVQPAVEAELDLLEEQVSDVLDPEQRNQWHNWLGRMRRTWVPPVPPE